MDHRLRTLEGAALYIRRSATAEPGIGNFKKLLDRFSRRGRDAVLGEAYLTATAFNLIKIFRAAPAQPDSTHPEGHNQSEPDRLIPQTVPNDTTTALACRFGNTPRQSNGKSIRLTVRVRGAGSLVTRLAV